MRWLICSIGALALVSACGTRQPVTTASAPPPKAADRTQPPYPPRGAPAGFKVPPKGVDGRYVTPNSNIGPLESLFSVRGAFNVAALGCTSLSGAAVRDDYNALLKKHKSLLNRANSAIDAKYRREHGSAGLRVRDQALTRLYNHYSQPSVKREFCSKTRQYLTAALAQSSSEFEKAAIGMLTDIESDFQAFFAEYENYEKRLADWQRQHGTIASR
jgi:hypothetical protein